MQRPMKMAGIGILMIILLPFIAQAQQEKAYQITGRIKGLKEGEKINMNLFHGRGFKEFVDWNRRDSAYVKNGEFHISGTVPDGPRLYFMEFDKHPRNVCRLLINNDKITISSDVNIEDIPHDFLDNSLKIDGSESNLAWQILIISQRCAGQIYGELTSHLNHLKDSERYDSSYVAAFLVARNEVNKSLYGNFLSNPDPAIASAIPFFIYCQSLFEQTNHAAFWKNVYDNWSDEVKNSFYGKGVKEELTLCAGQLFPGFSLPTPEGKAMTLNDALSKNGLTIVQFWATNSYHRESFQNELRQLYNKYHNGGLNVIGVSSDTVDYQWKGFVGSQNLPWPNVSDLKGKQGVVGNIYREYGAPNMPNTTNVLLDAKGKIVAWDIYGAELEWYLSKYLPKNSGDKNAQAPAISSGYSKK